MKLVAKELSVRLIWNLRLKICYICKEKFENKYLKDKKYRNMVKLQIIVILQGNIEVLRIGYLV